MKVTHIFKAVLFALMVIYGYSANQTIENLKATVETQGAQIKQIEEALDIHLKIFETHKNAILHASEAIEMLFEKYNKYSV